MARNWGSRPWVIDFRSSQAELQKSVDLAVLGGGFTGLAAAVWYKTLAPEKTVALFEADGIGAGASGHTGGMVLAETAVGDLPGLGDVLGGYQKILGKLDVQADLKLPGVFELGRSRPVESSPVHWKDSGELRVIKEVEGGSVNPGKVLSGLARAGERAGVLFFENAAIEDVRFREEITLCGVFGNCQARKVLFATNAFALELNGLKGRAESAFTTAVMTEPLGEKVIEESGLAERKPFYTVDLPYLWGKFLEDSVIFGAGLLFFEDWRGLYSLNIDEGEALVLYEKLERRIRQLHPAFRKVNFTHRWGGPICIADEWKPVFEYHPESRNAIVLGAYSGHGVAQSVYLGVWAAEALLGRRALPDWK